MNGIGEATLKDKLAAGHAVTVINPGHPSPSAVELLGALGADALFIDCEHGMAGPERVQEMCRAARAVGKASIVRPEANRDWLITRYLDAGATGIMVPHIDTADAARSLVAAVRYARPSADSSTVVVALVESPLALQNLDAIAAVEGLDALFVGSGDLANAMGLAGQRSHPDVVGQVLEAGRRIVAAGKVAGTRVTTQSVPQFREAGFRLLYENANAFLAQGFAQFQRAAMGPPP